MIKRKIMIIDDDKKFLQEIQATLDLSGYKTIAVNDSTNALNVARIKKPDLILLDLKMDKMSGFQVAKVFKQTPEIAWIPIIAISAIFNKEDHAQMMDLCGIKMGLKKPFRTHELIKQIEKVLKGEKC